MLSCVRRNLLGFVGSIFWPYSLSFEMFKLMLNGMKLIASAVWDISLHEEMVIKKIDKWIYVNEYGDK